jgi:hypothetical protein
MEFPMGMRLLKKPHKNWSGAENNSNPGMPFPFQQVQQAPIAALAAPIGEKE